MIERPRRNRKNKRVRELIAETQLNLSDFIFPLFVVDSNSTKTEVASMPGIFRFPLEELYREIESCLELGIGQFALFPAIEDSKKDKTGSEALNEDGINLKAIREIKRRFPDALIISDVALDPYSSDGHDGIVEGDKILNDDTLPLLAQMAVAQAQAGSDIVAPSDMMDGRVFEIRKALDEAGFSEVSIMAYTAKYASAFYGPFRDALDSAPKKGNKKSYQMDPRNRREAIREAYLDQSEGADFLMVKPALAYLDVISDIKQITSLPIAAYNVSGEYAMVKAAEQKGWVNGKEVRNEILTSIKRAGADIILSYFAKEWAEDLKG
ncbi:MAG: porphobilinogen synthase [Bdellovibrionales bacterium]|nr:porphobilinogen synthase [Bdellovibrionales bacterium]